MKDGVHLSAHGLTKLGSNISLSQAQQPPTSRTTKNRPPSRQGPPAKNRVMLAVTGRETGLLRAPHGGQGAATIL